MIVLYGVFGTGGFGRECIALAHDMLSGLHNDQRSFELCFVEHRPNAAIVNGYRVLSLEQFLSLRDTSKRFSVAVANPFDRLRIANEIEAEGIEPFTIRSRTSEIHPTARVGEGAILCQFTLVSANSEVGRHFHLNHHGYVSHDCRIGDFVTFAPAVRCNGTIEIGDTAYVGAGAIIRQGTPARSMRLGKSCIVGMGAVVLNSVGDGITVAGNPAKPLEGGRD